jgi:type IV pilus assembly protein PilV
MNRTAKMQTQRGFTLIEILVAMVVLAIGLLGLAGFQSKALQYTSSAYMRSQATSFAYDMADRMRVNRQAALAGDYDDVVFVTPTCVSPLTLTGTIDEQDEDAWQDTLACTLPLGTGRITRNGNLFTITIRWDDSRGQDKDLEGNVKMEQFEMETEL